VLRHFTAEAAAGEVWGCDIDTESVRQLRDNLCPPFRVFEVRDDHSPLPENYFGLIYAISVFTHVADGAQRRAAARRR